MCRQSRRAPSCCLCSRRRHRAASSLTLPRRPQRSAARRRGCSAAVLEAAWSSESQGPGTRWSGKDFRIEAWPTGAVCNACCRNARPSHAGGVLLGTRSHQAMIVCTAYHPGHRLICTWARCPGGGGPPHAARRGGSTAGGSTAGGSGRHFISLPPPAAAHVPPHHGSPPAYPAAGGAARARLRLQRGPAAAAPGGLRAHALLSAGRGAGRGHGGERPTGRSGVRRRRLRRRRLRSGSSVRGSYSVDL